jgi:LPXTG-site transpeptidase (sortase) family protein
LYCFLFVAFGALLEATHPPAPDSTSVAAPVSSHETSAHTESELPKQLIIPRLGMNLSVVPGQYNPATKTWTLTDDKVQFADITSLPNDRSGNTLLYGHNTAKVLAPTDHMMEGDIAQVTTVSGQTFTYAFSSGRLVDPSDTSVLKETDAKPQLTLLTCDGLWDEKRRLMTFDFVSVE